MRSTTILIILVLLLGLVSNASAGLVAHYEFEGDFSDSSGHNLHGSPQNGASIIADPERGNVLSLTSNQYVDCGADPLFNITETITVTAWIKVNVFDKDSQAIVSKGGFWGLNRDGTNNELEFSCLGLSPSNISGSKNVNDGQWHHVAGVYDRSELSLYVDGIVDASAAASGTISTTTGSLTVGVNVRLYPSYWNGLIDDVRIYDHALSPAQIAGLIGKMGTAYTYQGRLLDDNKPADGSFDLEFKLYNDPDSGTQQGSTITINQLDVIDGYFTVELDFGSGVFTGDPHWLEIGVRPGEFDDPNVYTVLSPRQMITPTPYALLALNGGDGHSLDAADGDPTDAVYVDNEGNVGIGTTSPSGSLHPDSTTLEIAGNAPSIVLDDQWGIAQDDFEISNGGDKVLFRNATDGLDILNIGIAGDVEGCVGIGTTSPARPLHIQDSQGSIRIDRDENCPSVYMVRTAPGNFSSVWKNFGLGTSADGEGSGHFFIADLGTATGGAGTERIHIDNEGKVGIGTTSPLYALDVLGDARVVGFMNTESLVAATSGHGYAAAVSGFASNTGDYTNYGGKFSAYGKSGRAVYGEATGSDAYAGYFMGRGYFSDNVGIGTTNPSDKLDVNGNININSVYKIAGETVLSKKGIQNIFVGPGAGASNTYGLSNTFLGYEAGRDNTEGSCNTFVGYWAGLMNETGDNNTFIGCTAGILNTTGENNTFVGIDTGHNNQTGSGNVFIGYKAGYYETGSNKLYIANGHNDSNVLIYGDFAAGKVGIGTTSPVDALDVNGKVRIRDFYTFGIPPIYDVKVDAEGGLMKDTSSKRYKKEIRDLQIDPERVCALRPVEFEWKESGGRDVGLIAEEVDEVIGDLVIHDRQGRPDAVKYDKLAVYLLQVVKTQQQEITELKERICQTESLRQRLEALETTIQKDRLLLSR